MTRVAPLLVASLLSATAALAQGVPASIPEGARVRVYATGARGIMEFRGLRADTLALRSFDTRSELLLPVSTIQGLYVSRGPRSRPAAAFRGLSIGLAVGGALGAATGLFGDAQATGFGAVSRSERVVIGAVALGALGAAIGTLAGVSRPGEKWERVDLQRLRISSGPRGRRSVGVSFAF